MALLFFSLNEGKTEVIMFQPVSFLIFYLGAIKPYVKPTVKKR